MEGVLKPHGSLLATDRSKAVVFGVVLTNCFWGRCFMSYFVFFVVYLHVYVSDSGSITSVGEERAYLSAHVYL